MNNWQPISELPKPPDARAGEILIVRDCKRSRYRAVQAATYWLYKGKPSFNCIGLGTSPIPINEVEAWQPFPKLPTKDTQND